MTKSGRDLHLRRKAPNFVYKDNGFEVCWIQQNREASCEMNGTLSFWGLYRTYIISHQIILYGVYLACLSNFMCILAKKYVMMSLYQQKYICVCIYTHMYTRHVIGRSWVRVPPGVSYFPEILIVSRKPSAVESGCCFPCVVSISFVNF